MMRENQKGLVVLIQEVMNQMYKRNYGKKVFSRYRSSFRLLKSVSHDIGDDKLSEKLFGIAQSAAVRNGLQKN